MPLSKLDITSGFYEDLDLSLNAQRCFNMRPYRSINSGASSRDSVRQVHGWSTLPGGESSTTDIARGAISTNGLYFYVIGTNLFENDPDILGATDRGPIAALKTNPSTVRMASNGEVIAIIDTGNSEQEISYYDITANTFTTYNPLTGVSANETALASLLQSTGGTMFDVEFIDGYFIFCASKGLFASSLVTTNSGRDFNALDFQNLTYKADQTRAIKRYRNRLYAFGSESVQVFQNTAAPNFPLTEILGTALDFGVLSADTLIQSEGALYMIGKTEKSNFGIYRFDGSIQKLSTDVVDKQITTVRPKAEVGDTAFGGKNETFSDISHILWAYKFNNDSYIGFNFFFSGIDSPVGYTFAYDETQSSLFGSPKWHERGAYNADLANYVNFGYQFFQPHNTRGKIQTSIGIGLVPLNRNVGTNTLTGPYIPDEDKNTYTGGFSGGEMQQFFTTQWVTDSENSIDVTELKSSFYTNYIEDTELDVYVWSSVDGENYDLLGQVSASLSTPTLNKASFYKIGRSDIRWLFRYSNVNFTGNNPNQLFDESRLGVFNVSVNTEVELDA